MATQYRVKGKHIFRTVSGTSRPEVLEVGDVFEPSPSELRAFSDRLARKSQQKDR